MNHYDEKEEPKVRDARALVYLHISGADEYRPEELERYRPEGVVDRDWRLLIHAAEQRLLAEGVAFSPKGGVRRKATTSKQAAGRAQRFFSAGLRKIERATRLETVASNLEDDPEERRRIGMRELKRANAVLDARASMRRKPLPPGL